MSPPSSKLGCDTSEMPFLRDIMTCSRAVVLSYMKQVEQAVLELPKPTDFVKELQALFTICNCHFNLIIRFSLHIFVKAALSNAIAHACGIVKKEPAPP